MTNKVNQIQNNVPPIAWDMMNGEYQGVVEDVTDGFASPTNMENLSTQNKHCFLQGVLYFCKQVLIILHRSLLSNL